VPVCEVDSPSKFIVWEKPELSMPEIVEEEEDEEQIREEVAILTTLILEKT